MGRGRVRLPGSTTLFHLGALALFAFFLWETGDISSSSSATADEPIYIRSGLLIVHERDVSLNDISSPFLFKALNALPVLGLKGGVRTAELTAPSEKEKGWPPLLREWHAAKKMLRAAGPRTVLPLARLVPRLTGVALGLLIYIAAAMLLGVPAAFLSLAVYVLLPEVAAHSSLSTLEAGLAFTAFCTVVSLDRFLKTASLRWALLAGVCLGLTLLTKTTGAVLALFVVLAAAVRFFMDSDGRGRIVKGTVLIVFASWIVLNGAFSFDGSFGTISAQPEYTDIEKKISGTPGTFARVLEWTAENIPVPLPASYVHTLVTQVGIAQKGKRIFFNGGHSRQGWWWLMPLTFLIKMPLAFLVMLLIALFMRKSARVPWVYWGAAGFLLLFFTMTGRLSMGVRYLFPALPCLALAAGGGLAALGRRPRYGKLVVPGLLLWMALAVAAVHPYQLSFANAAAGGPKALYRLLGDSNVDWGQDLPALAELMEKEEIPRVRLSYFGSGDPSTYGIVYDPLPSVGIEPAPGRPWWFEKGYKEEFSLVPGVYAISANNLNGLCFNDPDLFSFFRDREPDFRAGYSVLVYDLEKETLPIGQ